MNGPFKVVPGRALGCAATQPKVWVPGRHVDIPVVIGGCVARIIGIHGAHGDAPGVAPARQWRLKLGVRKRE